MYHGGILFWEKKSSGPLHDARGESSLECLDWRERLSQPPLPSFRGLERPPPYGVCLSCCLVGTSRRAVSKQKPHQWYHRRLSVWKSSTQSHPPPPLRTQTFFSPPLSVSRSSSGDLIPPLSDVVPDSRAAQPRAWFNQRSLQPKLWPSRWDAVGCGERLAHPFASTLSSLLPTNSAPTVLHPLPPPPQPLSPLPSQQSYTNSWRGPWPPAPSVPTSFTQADATRVNSRSKRSLVRAPRRARGAEIRACHPTHRWPFQPNTGTPPWGAQSDRKLQNPFSYVACQAESPPIICHTGFCREQLFQTPPPGWLPRRDPPPCHFHDPAHAIVQSHYPLHHPRHHSHGWRVR